MTRIRFSSAAHRDVLDAQRWYAEQAPNLDRSFQEELDRVLERIQIHPLSSPIVRAGIRRTSLRVFPYGVFYTLRKDHVFVLGVVHHARHPRTWQRRH